MPIRVSEAIDSDTAERVSVSRTASGGYINGLFVQGPVSKFVTLASVQQPNPKELQIVDKGERAKSLLTFRSLKQLRALDDRKNVIADVVTYDGGQYKIIAEGNWRVYGYTFAIGALE